MTAKGDQNMEDQRTRILMFHLRYITSHCQLDLPLQHLSMDNEEKL